MAAPQAVDDGRLIPQVEDAGLAPQAEVGALPAGAGADAGGGAGADAGVGSGVGSRTGGAGATVPVADGARLTAGLAVLDFGGGGTSSGFCSALVSAATVASNCAVQESTNASLEICGSGIDRVGSTVSTAFSSG